VPLFERHPADQESNSCDRSDNARDPSALAHNSMLTISPDNSDSPGLL
jgi:hypothetical protein